MVRVDNDAPVSDQVSYQTHQKHIRLYKLKTDARTFGLIKNGLKIAGIIEEYLVLALFATPRQLSQLIHSKSS